MVYYLSKKDDTATLRLVFGDYSRMNASLYGSDHLNIDSILNSVNEDDSIKHFDISVGFCKNELRLSNYFKSRLNNSHHENDDKSNDEDDEKDKDSSKQNNIKDWTCPKCGAKDLALVDKHGNKYACASCIQIDIAQKILKCITDKCTSSIDNNTNILNAFLNRFKGLKKND